MIGVDPRLTAPFYDMRLEPLLFALLSRKWSQTDVTPLFRGHLKLE